MSEAVQETLPDPISSQIESPIDTGSDEANIRQAMRESQKRREETGQDSGFDDAGADTRARPHEWSGAGLISEKDSTREALQKAATHQTDTRKLEMGRAYLAATGAQPDDDFAYRGADLAAQMGRKPSELPTQKALTADRYGNVLEPIGDMDRRLWERDDVVANVREGTRIRAQGREAMAAAEEAQIAEAEQAAREAEYQRLEGTQSPEVQGQSPTVGEPSVAVATATDQPVTQPQAAAPDPLAQERAALQQQYNEAALQGEYLRMSASEREAAQAVTKWDAWAATQPDLQGQALANTVDRARRGDQKAIARVKQLQQAHQHRENWMRQYAATNEARVTKEIQLSQNQQQAQRAAYSKAADVADAEYKTWLSATHPAYASGKGFAALKQAATEYIEKDLGLSKQDWQAHWNQTGMLRNVAAQKAITAGALMRLQANGRKELVSHRVPPVQGHSPGFAPVTRGDEQAETDIASLQRQLAGATGNAAIRISTQLSQALRRAGRL